MEVIDALLTRVPRVEGFLYEHGYSIRDIELHSRNQPEETYFGCYSKLATCLVDVTRLLWSAFGMVAKILCVAEKPSIAKAVANHLGSSVTVVSFLESKYTQTCGC